MWRDSESEQDFLNFTELAEQIATLSMNHALLPISIGVFGGWGTGKSTVLRLVEDKVRNAGDKGPILIKFDAWLYLRAALHDHFTEGRYIAGPGANCQGYEIEPDEETRRSAAEREEQFMDLGAIWDF